MSFSIERMLNYALDSGASDLHLSTGSIPMVRIHGVMKKLQLPKLELSNMEAIKNEVLNENQKNIFEKNLELDFSTSLDNKGRFRVNFFHQINGLSAVFRTIPSEIKSTAELGLPPILNQLAMKEKGLVLLTGSPGSGKSTTLAAMIDYVNDNNFDALSFELQEKGVIKLNASQQNPSKQGPTGWKQDQPLCLV